MSTAAICVIAVCALLAFGSLVQAAKEVLVARAKPPACPCREVQSLTLTPGFVFELPPGADLTTRFGTVGADDVRAAFGDVARTLKKGH